MKPIRLTLIAVCSLLAACSTPQNTQYFVLPDSQFILPAQHGEEIAVRVVLSEPLTQGGLVYQTDEWQLHTAKNHLWANSLENALAARFANELNRQARPNYFVPAERSTSGKTLTIYVEAFQGSYQGQVLVQGFTRNAQGKGSNFKAEVAQNGDGYAAMLNALSQGISQAAQQIQLAH